MQFPVRLTVSFQFHCRSLGNITPKFLPQGRAIKENLVFSTWSIPLLMLQARNEICTVLLTLSHRPSLLAGSCEISCVWKLTPTLLGKGSLRDSQSAAFEVIDACSWHNKAPGETRVNVDYSALVSFFDPWLTSLVEARRNQTRKQYRILGISPADAADVRGQLVDIFSSDWQSIVPVVIFNAPRTRRASLESSKTRNITE